MRSVVGWIMVCHVAVNAYTTADSVIAWQAGIIASVGANYHQAYFGQLPSVPSCCTQYGASWHQAWSIEGLLKRRVGEIAQKPLALQMRAGFQSFNGMLKRQEFIGNVIQGDRRLSGISQYTLNATISALSLQSLIEIQVWNHLPLNVDAGIRMDWFVLSRYSQQEDLVSPTEGAVFETMTRTRNQFSGTIPSHAHVGFAISTGISYRFPVGSGWIINPEARMHIGLTPLADVKWYVHRLMLGIALLRPLPESITLPPQITPPPPPEPTVARSSVNVERRVLGVHHMSGDTAIIELSARAVLQRKLLIPVVFFPAQSAVLDELTQEHLRLIATSARRKGITMRLAPNIAPDESDSLRQERFNTVLAFLRHEGVNVEPIPEKAPMPQSFSAAITNELRAVWIRSPEPLVDETSIVVPLSEPSVMVVLEAQVQPSNQPHVLSTTIEQDGQTLTISNQQEVRAQLSPERLLNGQYSAYRYRVLVEGQGKLLSEQEGGGIVIPRLIVRDTVVTVNDGDGWLVLGYCNFDSPTIEYLDTVIAGEVKRAIARGNRVELLGVTDSLGSYAHNLALARRRAESALSLLKISSAPVQVGYRVGGVSSTGSLYDRLANRGVLVRIVSKGY